MLIKTDGNRKAAYDSVINYLLKDNRVYCNNCGHSHPDRLRINYICCDDPQVGTNLDHAKAVIKQNKEIRKSRMNEFASNDKDTLRWGVSLPRCVYDALDNYEKMLSSQDEPGRRLFKTKEDIYWFAKNYPQFAIPERM